LIALLGFNDLGRSVTPIVLLIDYFLHRFSTFSDKNEENLSFRSLIFFLQNAPSNSFLCNSRLSVRRFQMPFEGLSFVKTLAKFEILFTQQNHFYKI